MSSLGMDEYMETPSYTPSFQLHHLPQSREHHLHDGTVIIYTTANGQSRQEVCKLVLELTVKRRETAIITTSPCLLNHCLNGTYMYCTTVIRAAQTQNFSPLGFQKIFQTACSRSENPRNAKEIGLILIGGNKKKHSRKICSEKVIAVRLQGVWEWEKRRSL